MPERRHHSMIPYVWLMAAVMSAITALLHVVLWRLTGRRFPLIAAALCAIAAAFDGYVAYLNFTA